MYNSNLFCHIQFMKAPLLNFFGEPNLASKQADANTALTETEQRTQQRDLSEALGDLNRSANTSIFAISLAATAHLTVARVHVDANAVRVTGVAGVLILAYSLVRFVAKDLVLQINPKYRYSKGYFSWKGLFGAIPVLGIFFALLLGEIFLLTQLWNV